MQQKIYDYLVACIQAQGYPPSVREIGEAVGLRSPSTVHFHLKHLAEMGYIEIGAGKGPGHQSGPAGGAAAGAGGAGPHPHRGQCGCWQPHPGPGVHRGLPDL